MKGVPFVNGRYTKWVPVLSEMVYVRLRDWTLGGGGGVDSRYKTLLSIPLLLQNFRHLSQLSSYNECILLLSWLFIVYSTHLRIRECSWFATLDAGRKLYFLFPSIACYIKVQTPRTNLWQISWGTNNNNAKVNNLQLNSADREEKMTFSSSNESSRRVPVLQDHKLTAIGCSGVFF